MKMIPMLSSRVVTVAAVLALLVGTLVACGPASATQPAGGPRPLRIVAAFYPFQFIAQQVAGPLATVTSLTQPGAEPHDLELTPRQVASLSTADLVIYEHSFQAAVDEAVVQSGTRDAFDTATVVPLQPLAPTAQEPGTPREPQNGLDPHVWLDPANVATIAQEVERRLSALDPTHAADFARNAADLTRRLDGLGTSYRTGLADCDRQTFITTHAAFGYLARRYGLNQIGVSGLTPDAEPSPARIAEVQRQARDNGVTTIFYETLISPAVARSIAGDLGLRTDVLDPIEGITDQSKGRDYLDVMGSNLTALEAANGCR
jgi:zinc transport system substrate-binding protein